MTEADISAWSFFRTFARLEYALKAAGFHCGEGDANANWTTFAKSIEGRFHEVQEQTFLAAIEYYRAHPPMKQTIADGMLAWEVRPPQAGIDEDRILILVRRVRNNLFHGGKFNGRWFEPQRSVDLMRHGQVILETCLTLSPSVNEAFSNSTSLPG
jgi:hypothetical protein